MGWLEQHYDPKLDVDLTLAPEDISGEEIERLQAAVAMTAVALSIPRRIGGDANRAELALDKRRSRRVLHPLRQCLAAWGGKEREPMDEERQSGAQVEWPIWLEEHRAVVAGRTMYVATWAKRTSNLTFGKSSLVKLTQEVSWLEYSLRD